MSLQRKRAALVALILLLKLYKKKSRTKKYTVNPLFKQRSKHVHFNIGFQKLKMDNVGFKSYCSVSTVHFEELLFIIAPSIIKQYVIIEPISPEQRLLLTLRFLSSGDSITSLSRSYLISKTTVSKIISETCSVIWDIMHGSMLSVPSESDWLEIEKGFASKCNFSHCIGALGGRHITLKCPPNAGSSYYNYKHSHGIRLLATCDVNNFFRIVDISAYDYQSEGGILKNSKMGEMILKNEINIPAAKELYENGPSFPYIFVADEAFPLSKNLMRPYSSRSNLNNEKRIFNYRIKCAQMMIDKTFDIFSSKFHIFKKPITASFDNAQKYVKAGVCLHNWIKNEEDFDSLITNSTEEPNSNYINKSFTNLDRISYITSIDALNVRNKFADHFYNNDIILEQFEHVE